MKTIASLALATLTFASTPAIQAHDFYVPRATITIGGFGVHFDAPHYVCTKELCRSVESRLDYDGFGGYVSYNVMVITYADYYSDGSTRSYTRAYRV